MLTDRHCASLNPERPRLLFLDAYDSFSNNVVALLRSSLKARVTVIKIDDPRFLPGPDGAFISFLRRFDGVVVGPGPGDPHKPEDTGLITKLWRLPDSATLPVLGICLGFQSLILASGGEVVRLKQPRHGIVRTVDHRNSSIFRGLGKIRATQYHSLHGKLGHDLVSKDTLWSPSEAVPALEPLAWDFSDPANGPVLMGVRHVRKPFFGVQYHPESICTNDAGAQIVENWWAEASRWSRSMKSSGSRTSSPNRATDSGYASDTCADRTMSADSEGDDIQQRTHHPAFISNDCSDAESETNARVDVLWNQLQLPEGRDVIPRLADLICEETGRSPMILESGIRDGKPVREETGRYSILGFVDAHAEHFKYWTTRQRLEHCFPEVVESRNCRISEVFDHLKQWTLSQRRFGGSDKIPFWGGLLGYISYEAGLEIIDVAAAEEAAHQADVHFVHVRRSFVVDHVENTLYIQSLDQQDASWIASMSQKMRWIADCEKSVGPSEHATLQPKWKSIIARPSQDEYCSKVETCQSYIQAGDSYELCLTDQSRLAFVEDGDHHYPSIWGLYKRLRTTNPAPFGAFLEFDDVSIVCSSPERFLSWSRDGDCEFRPIKGTVQKGPRMTRETAEDILKSEKEQAENLMIVDLIRHDLNGVAGQVGRAAEVSKLMQVEEYATVYQLVSVIRAKFNSPTWSRLAVGGTKAGIDVLKASLPPGSMTGAPKKRSCELLRSIEGRNRRIYSGVLGYLDVGGGGDFNVVIRSAIRYDDGWRIGAGGAVTGLSDASAEFEEMMGKSKAVQL